MATLLRYSVSGSLLKGRFLEKELGHFMDSLFEIELERPIPGSRDAGRRLYRLLKEAIQDGRLAAGTRLAASRKLADFCGLSRNTVAEIYDRLSKHERPVWIAKSCLVFYLIL